MKFGDLSSRQAGLLLALSSLPGEYGIGDMGKSAYDFIDIVSAMGFKIWQMLPINPSSEGNSPYSPFTSYGGDEVYLSLIQLQEDGLIKSELPQVIKTNHVDYDLVRKLKHEYLVEAFNNFKPNESFNEFKKETKTWLNGYCQYMALKDMYPNLKWMEWPTNKADAKLVSYHEFIQYLFYQQFSKLKKYAHQKNVSLMGDLPIYVGLDSADVYFNKECFQLDKNNLPIYVSGASPDYFSEDGQLWNHPIYDWKYLKDTRYQYWVDRLSWVNSLFDILRIDHFRAFDTYWQVPYGQKTARNGKWVEGPAYDFFDQVLNQIPSLNMIVEDLGELRPEVGILRDHYNFMGMRIMQYSFGPNEEKDNYELPENCVVYSGTHDNAPLYGWASDLTKKEQADISKILNRWSLTSTNLPNRVLERVFTCSSRIAVCQVQDLLEMGNEARLNLPGTEGDPNWAWKLVDLVDLKTKIANVNELLVKTNRI